MNTQINGTEWSAEIDLHMYGELIFNKGAKTIQWNWTIAASTIGYPYRCMTFNPYIAPYTQINSTQNDHWPKKYKPIKTLEDIGKNLFDLGLNKDFTKSIIYK